MYTLTITGAVLNDSDTAYTTVINNRTSNTIYPTYTSDGTFYTTTIEEPNIGDILEVDITGVNTNYTNKLYHVYDGTTTIIQEINLVTSVPLISVSVTNNGLNNYILNTNNHTVNNIYNVYLRRSSVTTTAGDTWMHVETIKVINSLDITFLVRGTYRIDTNLVSNNISTTIQETTISIANDISNITKNSYIEWE